MIIIDHDDHDDHHLSFIIDPHDQEYCDDFYDLPREFNILGSCLFHKVQSCI